MKMLYWLVVIVLLGASIGLLSGAISITGTVPGVVVLVACTLGLIFALSPRW